MPILIQDFINTKLDAITLEPDVLTQRRTQLAGFLNKMLSFAPSCLATQSSEYYSNVYRQQIDKKEKITIMTCIVEKIFHPISLTQETIRSCCSFWNIRTQPTVLEQQRLFLVQNAAVFAHTNLGNCAKRASYAAIELFEILMGTGSELQLTSYPEIDHFVLRIGNAAEGWNIYDPLTNPELLFNEDEFTIEIKPLFPRVPIPKNPVNFSVDAPTIALFDFQLRKIATFVAQESQNATLRSLKQDVNICYSLLSHDIDDPRFEKLEAAYDAVCCVIGWENPSSETNIPLS